MIASLRGIIIFKSTHYIIVEVQGVGYGVYVSLSTFYKLPEIGDTVFLNIHTYVKEDLIHLFGFFSPEEKQIFQNIISVSGIGPRLAVNILSGKSPEDLTDAIASKN
ncbi:MAG: Holliday junction branch migration protein RuvA [Syntrophales bacterium]|jgi:Holliday junction DNA helicase RuvA|nr:Holliday junction branch migration protein RuvA [Syntrophales bacterium]